MAEKGLTHKQFSMTGSIVASGNIMSLLNFSTTLPDYAFYGMFEGCTSLTTAPELPATTLAKNCYNYMFNSCSKLNYVKAMFTSKSTYYDTNAWLKKVSSTGTFVKNSAATWTNDDVGIPSGWTVETASPDK